jgi:hypothetical protein
VEEDALNVRMVMIVLSVRLGFNLDSYTPPASLSSRLTVLPAVRYALLPETA